YFDLTQIPHDVSFAYGENIAVKAGTTEKLSMGAAYANLTRWLMSDNAAWEPIDEKASGDNVARTISSWSLVQKFFASQRQGFRLPIYALVLFLLIHLLIAWKPLGLPELQNPMVQVLQRLQQLTPRQPAARLVLVTLKPGVEPPEIFGNNCRQ